MGYSLIHEASWARAYRAKGTAYLGPGPERDLARRVRAKAERGPGLDEPRRGQENVR